MEDFPEFMKKKINHIDSGQQNTKDIDGYYYTDGEEIVLNPGDEIFVPKGTIQGGRYVAGTRTISAFGG